MGRCVLALDPGGSKCEALLVRDDGTILGMARVQQPGVSGRSMEVIAQAVRQVVEGRSFEEIHLATIKCCDPLRMMIRTVKPPLFYVLHEADAPLALVGERFGVVVVAGTGGCAMGQSRGGRFLYLDGFGPTLGDAGSGYQIGMMALRAAARATMHPRHATSLSAPIFDACQKHIGESSAAQVSPPHPPQVVGVMSRYMADDVLRSTTDPGTKRLGQLVNFSLEPHDRSVIASLARIVDEEANRGDAVAIRILMEAAACMAETVRDLVDLLQMANDPYLLIGMGSVALHSRVYWDCLCNHVKEIAPRMTHIRSPWPPVVGNALVALCAINHGQEDRVRKALFDSARTCFMSTEPKP